MVWTAADPINRYVFVKAVELCRRSVSSPRVQAVIRLLAEASLAKVSPAEHGRGNLCRGPAWHVNAYPFCSHSCGRPDGLRAFRPVGNRAAAACVGTVKDLKASGVHKESVEWLDVLHPVANVRGSKPTDDEPAVAWAPSSIRQQRTIATSDEVARCFTEPACLYLRLCFLFGVKGEQDAIRRQCHCFFCTADGLPL